MAIFSAFPSAPAIIFRSMTRKNVMKKNFLYKTFIFSGLLMVFSCSQDAIFYKVSTETIPEKPRIPGAPTNMVVFERNGVPIMYVASGSLHWYANSTWDSPVYGIPQPGDKIIGLAATNAYLYALSISSSGATTTLRRFEPSENVWINISIIDEGTYTLIQSIYADKDSSRLFAGAMNNGGPDFGILYLDDTSDPQNPALKLLQTGDNTEMLMLSGAVSLGGIHYLCTRGRGVYKISETDLLSGNPPVAQQLPELVSNNEGGFEESAGNRLFMGMIKLEDGSIIVVQRNNGEFFRVESEGIKQIGTVATGRYATGALALWQQVIVDENGGYDYDSGYKMLVAGIQGGLYSSTTTSSSYTHGYVEFYLTPDGSLELTSPRNDPPTITVDGLYERYSATIGKHPINHMFQVPKEIDPKKIFFASTQTGGLWSYRDRSDGVQWNAEN